MHCPLHDPEKINQQACSLLCPSLECLQPLHTRCHPVMLQHASASPVVNDDGINRLHKAHLKYADCIPCILCSMCGLRSGDTSMDAEEGLPEGHPLQHGIFVGHPRPPGWVGQGHFFDKGNDFRLYKETQHREHGWRRKRFLIERVHTRAQFRELSQLSVKKAASLRSTLGFKPDAVNNRGGAGTPRQGNRGCKLCVVDCRFGRLLYQ